MARRKLREQKSKTAGTTQVLKQLNTSAHTEEHSKATPGSPGGTTFTAVMKWGWGE